MDVEILADVFSFMCCKDCGESNIQLTEISFQRHVMLELWVDSLLSHVEKDIKILRGEQKTCLWDRNDWTGGSISQEIPWNHEHVTLTKTKGI